MPLSVFDASAGDEPICFSREHEISDHRRCPLKPLIDHQRPRQLECPERHDHQQRCETRELDRGDTLCVRGKDAKSCFGDHFGEQGHGWSFTIG